MSSVNISIPLRVADQKGFYSSRDESSVRVLGWPVKLRVDEPYLYLEVLGVAEADVPIAAEQIRSALPWAALRLDCGMLAPQEPPKSSATASFDAQFNTSYPATLDPRPFRVWSRHRTQLADVLLLQALDDSAQVRAFKDSEAAARFTLSCEMFAAVDFEASPTAQFLTLVSVLEVMARPEPRPPACLDIIDAAIIRMTEEAAVALDTHLRDALTDMRKAAEHWKVHSIRGSVKRLAMETASASGENAKKAGKVATTLYDQRSKMLHQGGSATKADALAARHLVRRVLLEASGVKAELHKFQPAIED